MSNQRFFTLFHNFSSRKKIPFLSVYQHLRIGDKIPARLALAATSPLITSDQAQSLLQGYLHKETKELSISTFILQNYWMCEDLRNEPAGIPWNSVKENAKTCNWGGITPCTGWVSTGWRAGFPSTGEGTSGMLGGVPELSKSSKEPQEQLRVCSIWWMGKGWESWDCSASGREGSGCSNAPKEK